MNESIENKPSEVALSAEAKIFLACTAAALVLNIIGVATGERVQGRDIATQEQNPATQASQ